MTTLKFDPQQMKEVRDALKSIKLGYPRALNAALNKTVGQARTLAVAGVNARLNLTKKVIREYTAIHRSNFNTLTSKLDVIGKPVPLANYGAREVKRGVTVKVRRDGSRELIQGAFMRTMKSGHTGVFKRGIEHQYRKKAAPRREARNNVWGSTVLPIDELDGPHISEVFRYEAEKAVSETSAGVLAQNLDHEMNRVYTQYWDKV
jgi:hypothetical protein